MDKTRMASFSDGVVAILITIMVLNLNPPHDSSLDSLRPLVPTFVSYIFSFVMLGTYWNNHHHLISMVERVDGRTLWANLHLLFWLSLIPFGTSYVGQTKFGPWPVALYGVDLLLCALAYFLLVHTLTVNHPALAAAMGSDFKGKASVVIYAVSVPLAFVNSWVAYGLYIAVVAWWLVPDRRIENKVGSAAGATSAAAGAVAVPSQD